MIVDSGLRVQESGHRWSHTPTVHCLDCGVKYAEWIDAKVREMNTRARTASSTREGL